MQPDPETNEPITVEPSLITSVRKLDGQLSQPQRQMITRSKPKLTKESPALEDLSMGMQHISPIPWSANSSRNDSFGRGNDPVMNSLREGPSHKGGKVPNRIDEQTVLLSFNPSHENSYGRGNDPIMNLLREGSSHNVGKEVTGVDELDDHSSAASSGDEEQNRVEEEEQTPIPVGLLYPLDSHFLARLNNNTSSVKAVKAVCRAYGLNPNTPKWMVGKS